jgi:hypothetical protein
LTMNRTAMMTKRRAISMGFLETVNEEAVNLDFFDNQAAALHLHNAMRACCGYLTLRQ